MAPLSSNYYMYHHQQNQSPWVVRVSVSSSLYLERLTIDAECLRHLKAYHVNIHLMQVFKNYKVVIFIFVYFSAYI